MYRILFVDDELLIRQGMQQIIHWPQYGFSHFDVVDSGDAALAHLKSCPTDVVITDITMPFMNGLQLIEEIQKQNFDPIFLILSGYNEFNYAQQAIRLGVSDYLLKPVQEKELICTMQDVFQRLNAKTKGNATGRSLISSLYQRCNKPIMRDMLAFIEQQLNGNLTLDTLSSVFYLSPNYISQLIKKELNLNFIDLLTTFRMEYAKVLLTRDTTLRIGAIASQVGYDDSRYFSQVFKRYANMTPKEYRNSAGNPTHDGADNEDNTD